MKFSCFTCGYFHGEDYPKDGKCTKCGAADVGTGFAPVGTVSDAVSLGTKAAPLPRRATGVPFLDEVLSGGIVKGHLVLLAGSPGVGKTTLSLHILNRAERPLFISAEQPVDEIQAIGERLQVDLGRILFHSETGLGQIETLCRRHNPTDLVIDSLGCVWLEKRRNLQAGSARTLTLAMNDLFHLAHGTKTTIWVITHVNNKGRASGPTALIHWCDVHLGFTSDEYDIRTLQFPHPKKNRGGPTHPAVRLAMTERGLEYAPKVDAVEALPLLGLR